MYKILFTSSKGGVGKTTVTVFTALALNRYYNRKVGILDADVTDPDVPRVLGDRDRSGLQVKDFKLIPKIVRGVRVISMYYEVMDDVPFIIYGKDRAERFIRAFCKDVDWGDIDYLFIDSPPTTTDEIMGILQHLDIDGAILILQGNTKQSIAGAKKVYSTLKYFNKKVLGFVCNMSSIFFNDNVDPEKELGLKKLADIPLERKLRIDMFRDLAKKIIEIVEG